MTEHASNNAGVLAMVGTGNARQRPAVVDDVVVKINIDLEHEKVRSHIAHGDEFVGNLNCSAGVRISGTIRGDVTCATGAVVVESGGLVTGSVNGKENIFINGRVGEDGGDAAVKVCTPGLITLMDEAVVHANIEYGRLATYGDMTHNGTCRKIQPTR